MLWLGLLTYCIGIFILECLLFIFGLHMSYETGLGLALLNAIMGFLLGALAYWRGRPAEIWGLYGTVAWPIALIHILSISIGADRPQARHIDQIGQQSGQLDKPPVSTINVMPLVDRDLVSTSSDTAVLTRLEAARQSEEPLDADLTPLQPTKI